MSRTSKYYVKKISKTDVSGCKSIKSMFQLQMKNDQQTEGETSLISHGKQSSSSTSGESERSILQENEPQTVSLSTESTTEACDETDTVSDAHIVVDQPEQNAPPASSSEQSSSSIEQNSSSIEQSSSSTDKSTKGTKRPLPVDFESQYDWLYCRLKASKRQYFCKVCEIFKPLSAKGAESPFVTGTELGNHPHRKLTKHDTSNVHEEAVKRYVQYKAKETCNISNHASTNADIARNQKYIDCLIDSVYLAVKKHWALDSVSDIMEHLSAQNCPAVVDYQKFNKTKYTSSISVSECLESIGSYIEASLLEKINKCKYITLLADESTDEANRTQFAILIRCLVGTEIDDHFVGLVHVKRTDAASLMVATEEFLRDKAIPIHKIMFVGFDGCNTMSGVNKGLQRRFRHQVPHSIYINCRSHRLALCIKHLIKDFPIIEEVDGLMLLIYKTL